MKILALIPARGGSKRLPEKNTKMLGELPLIAWTIKAALASGVCTDVMVSTDDLAIAQVAREHGANVPWLRPAELASDIATSVDVAIHALDAYEKSSEVVDGLLLLQPTSPFRGAESIRNAVSLFEASRGMHPVVSVSQALAHPAWCFRATAHGMAPFLGWRELQKRSQDLEPAWMLNGAIYVISPTRLRQQKSFLTSDTMPLLMDDPSAAIDIDTASDFAQCEAVLSAQTGATFE